MIGFCVRCLRLLELDLVVNSCVLWLNNMTTVNKISLLLLNISTIYYIHVIDCGNSELMLHRGLLH